MRRVLSWKRFAIVLAVLGTLSAATYGVHVVQVRRNASILKDRAAEAEKAAAADPDKAEEAAQLYADYLKFRPKDEDAHRRYAALMFTRAKADPKYAADAADVAEAFLRLFPDHPEDRRKLIGVYMDLGRLTTAREHLKMLMEGARKAEFEKDVDLLDKAASCEIALGGNTAQAVVYLDRAAATMKAPPAVFARLLDLLQGPRKFNDPRYQPSKYLAMLTEQEPYRSDIEARVAAARAMLQAGEVRNARDHVEQALKMPGGAVHPDALMAAAELELAEMKTPEAVRPQLKKAEGHLRTAFAHAPRNVAVGLKLATVLTDQGEPKQAAEVLRTTAANLGETNDQYAHVVDRLLDLGEKDLALKLIDKLSANKIDADRLGSYFRGRLALLDGQWAAARDLLQQSAPFLIRVREFHKKAMFGIARCYEAVHNPDKQLEYCNLAVQDDPYYFHALVGRAEALYRLGRHREALPEYKSLVNGWGQTGMRPRLARLELLAALKQPPAGREWGAFDAALGPAADLTPELRVLRAESLIARDQKDEAAKELTAVVAADPKNAAAWLALARITGGGKTSEMLGQLDAAAAKAGNSVDLRLARSLVLVNRVKKPTAAELRALADGADTFDKADQRRLWLGIGEAAARAAQFVEGADSTALLALAITATQTGADLDPADLAARATLVDLGIVAHRPEVVDAALAGMAAVEGEKGPMGTLARVVRRLPEVDKMGDRAARPAAIAELRALALRAKADRPGWGRVYVALGQLDEMDGLTDEAVKNYREAIDRGERQEFVIRRAVELYRNQRKDDQAFLLLQSLHTEVTLPEDLERFRAIKDLLTRDIPNTERHTIDKVAPADSKEWRLQLLRGSLLAAVGADAEAAEAFRKATDMGFDVPEPWGARISHLVRRGLTDDARKATQVADDYLKNNPPKTPAARADMLVTVALCYEMTGDLKTAAARYQEAVAATPKGLNPNRERVLFLVRTGNAAAADQLLRRFADDAPQDLARWARRYLAISLATNGDTYNQRAAAMEFVERNLKDNPDESEDKKARAVVLAADPATRAEAGKLLKEFAKWGDLTPDEYLLLARLYFAQGEVFESVEFFEKAARPRAGLNVTHLTTLIQVYLGINQLPKARAAVARLKAMAPRSWEATREEARLLHREAARQEADNKDEARKLREQARSLILNAPGAATEAMVRTRVGPLLEELGYKDDAARLYDQVYREGKEPVRHLPLAGFLINQKRTAEALDLAFKHEADAPPVVTARLLTAAIKTNSPGRPAEEKVAAWLDAKLAQPGEKWEHLSLLGSKAELLDATARYDDSIRTYEEAIRLATAARPEELKGFRWELFVNNLAMVLVLHRRDQGEAERAIKMMTEVIGRRGPAAAYLDTRAVAYIVQGGRTREATADLTLALVQQRKPVYLFHLAWVHDLDNKPALRDTAFAEAKKLGLTAADLHPLEARKFADLDRGR